MYDVEKLIGMVCDFLSAEEDYQKYILEARKNDVCLSDGSIWIPFLGGSEACRLGELSGRRDQASLDLSTVCNMLDVDQDRLIAAVKSMLRKERHNGHWDNPNLTCWIGYKDKKGLCDFLSDELGEFDYSPWYSSTGRKKKWCT